MRPGILLICDPQTARARDDVGRMVASLDAGPATSLIAASGRGWAAVAVAPPAEEPSCGADIHSDGRDVVIWAGEILLPEDSQPVAPVLIEPATESGQDNGGTPVPHPRRRASCPPSKADETSALVVTAPRRSGEGHADPRTISRVLLRRLREKGVEALGRLDGAFCGAWFDHRSCRWTVFNDRWGLLPVFWSAHDARLIVSPSARVTWEGGGEALEISDVGVVDLVRTGNMVDDHTLIEGVHWLKGGHVLYWGEEGCGTYGYWDPVDLVSGSRDTGMIDDLSGAIDGYLDALQATIEEMTAGPSPLLLGLSGGIDSRMFLAMCRGLGRVPDSFTAGWSFADDVRFGRRAAAVAGAPHTWVPLDEANLHDRLTDAIVSTDGLHGVAHLAPTMAIRDFLRERNGHGVLLEGYLHGWPAGQYIPADEEVAGDAPPHQRRWARRFLHAGGDVEQINVLLRPQLAFDSFRRWKTFVNDRFNRAPFDDPLSRAEYTVVSGRSGRIDVLGTALLRQDVAVRTPACHAPMLAWTARVSPRLRRGKKLCVEVLRRRFPDLARVPRTGGDGLPPSDDPWLREVCWQREKLHRAWVGLRHRWTRRWGTGGRAVGAWTFDAWRRSGGLDMLREDGARVLEWVEPEALKDLWRRAVQNPLEAGPLMSLATLEVMIRRLEQQRREEASVRCRRVTFRTVAVGIRHAPDNADLETSVCEEGVAG